MGVAQALKVLQDVQDEDETAPKAEPDRVGYHRPTRSEDIKDGEVKLETLRKRSWEAAQCRYISFPLYFVHLPRIGNS